MPIECHDHRRGATRRWWMGYDLADVRMRLWKQLRHRSCDFDDPEVNAVRLVLCATYDTWERGHLFEALMAVRDFALAVDVDYDVLGDVLRKRFHGLIGDC